MAKGGKSKREIAAMATHSTFYFMQQCKRKHSPCIRFHRYDNLNKSTSLISGVILYVNLKASVLLTSTFYPKRYQMWPSVTETINHDRLYNTSSALTLILLTGVPADPGGVLFVISHKCFILSFQLF